MNKYKVAFNFDSGKYDVIDRDKDEIISSWGTHAEAITESNYLNSGGEHELLPIEE